MLLLQLFFIIFFINNSTSTYQTVCYTGDQCNVLFYLTDFSPNRHTLSSKCSLVNSSSCWVYGEVDYETRLINVTLTATSKFIDPSVKGALLSKNPFGITALYYIVKIEINPQRRSRLTFFIECRLFYKCSTRELRHYWLRLTQITEREKLVQKFHELLEPSPSDNLTCLTNLNESSICQSNTNACFADHDSKRGCPHSSNQLTPSWIFEYNVIREPGILNHTVKRFYLTCSSDRCNNNYTTAYLIHLSRQFAHNAPARLFRRNSQPPLIVLNSQLPFLFLLFLFVSG